MKTSIYIEDGRTQIILTPENEFETGLIKNIKDKQVEIAEFTGSFKDCVGGFIRQYSEKNSLMLLLKENKEEN